MFAWVGLGWVGRRYIGLNGTPDAPNWEAWQLDPIHTWLTMPNMGPAAMATAIRPTACGIGRGTRKGMVKSLRNTSHRATLKQWQVLLALLPLHALLCVHMHTCTKRKSKTRDRDKHRARNTQSTPFDSEIQQTRLHITALNQCNRFHAGNIAVAMISATITRCELTWVGATYWPRMLPMKKMPPHTPITTGVARAAPFHFRSCSSFKWPHATVGWGVGKLLG